MNRSTLLLVATWALILAVLAFAGGYFTRKMLFPAGPVVFPTDTVWRWHEDTAKLASSKPAGSVIAVLPTVHPQGGKTPANGDLIADSATFLQNGPVDTLQSAVLPDSVAVEVPIEQRTYEGEYYRAVVQGFRPELVSIDIRLPEVAAPRRKRWAVTIGPQVGYGFTPAGWQPYAGVGITAGFTF